MMENKKTLIITYFEAPNYGAFLQAFATQEFLKSRNIDAYILPHKANQPSLLTKYFDRRVPPEKLTNRELLQKEIDKVCHRLNLASENTKYDVAIIGSDEIWNVKNLTARHLSVFFKPYRNAEKTIAYSACAGSCQKKHMRMFPYTSGVRRLHAVSVRDDHTEKLAHEMGIKDVKRTLDPTFLIDFTSEVPERKISEDYLLVYTYGLNEESILCVREYAEKKQLKIIATGSECKWADDNPMVSPFEWLSLIKYSSCVVTSTFHGSVFSIIFNKQFVVVDTDSNKLKSLLEELELTSRRAARPQTISELFDAPIDYEHINHIVEEKREQSRDYLLSQF